jgi:hypothetical protein
MIRSLFISIVAIGLFYSCKKFEHEDVLISKTDCELCNWADSLNGSYAGYLTTTAQNYMGTNQWIDSLHFDVQHVFLAMGPLDDSTRMYFTAFNSGSQYINSGWNTWFAEDSSGTMNHTSFSTIRITKDSIVFGDHYSEPFFGASSTSISKSGVLYRQ